MELKTNINYTDNSIIISKNTNFINPSFKLNDVNTDAIFLNEKEYKIFFNTNSILQITDGLFSKKIIITIPTKKIAIDYLKDIYYKNEKIFLVLENPNKESINIIVSGDINKTFSLKDYLETSIYYPIKNVKTINFIINDINYSKTLYNLDDFPNELYLVNGGLKINKPCIYDLQINDFTIPKNTTIVYGDFKDGEYNVYYNNNLIFSQEIISHKYPTLTIVNNPLRAVLNYVSDDIISFNINDDYYKINAGDKEILLKQYNKISLLKISNYQNVILEKNNIIV